MRKLFCSLLLLLLCGCVPDAGLEDFPEAEDVPELQLRGGVEAPHIGDPMIFELRLMAEERLPLPPWPELLHPSLVLIDAEPRKTEAELEQFRHRIEVVASAVTNITLFAENQIQVGDQQLQLPFYSIEVQSILRDEDTVPMFGNRSLPEFRSSEALARARRNQLISLGLFLLLIAAFAYAMYRISKRPKAPPPPPEWDRLALEAMQQLCQSPAWLQEDADAVAVELSRILRTYIEGRFLIQAPDRTTEEFLRETAEHPLWPQEDQQGLAEFFSALDRIKFAAHRPGIEELERLLKAGEVFVRMHGNGRGGQT